MKNQKSILVQPQIKNGATLQMKEKHAIEIEILQVELQIKKRKLESIN